MENRLFREKSLERITSPEQLQDYMRVTNPGVWMVLAAVIALLAGLLIASAMATLESSLPVKADVREGVVLVELPLSQKDNVAPGMSLRVGGQEAKIEILYQEKADTISAKGSVEDLPDGTYDAEIVTETLTPISLLFR